MFYPDINESKNEFMDRCVNCLCQEGFLKGQSIELCDRYYFQEQKIIDINTTYTLINESLLMNINEANSQSSESIRTRVIATDSNSNSNKIFPRPKGVVLCDTYNNPFFPIELPKVDTSTFNLPEIKSRFHSVYSGEDVDYLPWHFVVEFIRSEYFIFNTRPLDMQFPLSSNDAKRLSKVQLNSNTEQFFKKHPFNLNQAIHIVIIGDSNTDVYLQGIYELIGRNCIGPILRYFKLTPTIGGPVQLLNLGPKFKTSLLERNIKR